MNKPSRRIDITGSANPLVNNPFASLDVTGTATGPAADAGPIDRPTSVRRQPNRNRGRIDVVRQTAGRGGKTVTVLSGFKGIAESELREIARNIQRVCGTGGTVKSGTIEIHGDQRDKAMAVLEEAGFRPVSAGG